MLNDDDEFGLRRFLWLLLLMAAWVGIMALVGIMLLKWFLFVV